jgi:hypothetical protein
MRENQNLNTKLHPSLPRSMTHLSPNQTTQATPEKTSLNMKISMIQKENSAEPQTPLSVNESDIHESRGRDKKRSTGIFGTLKKRLSRSRTRKEENNGNEHQMISESQLSTPANNTNRFSGTFSRLSLPISRKSSFSEASAISNSSRMSSVSKTSTKTFLHEASTLVLEVVENGVTR